MEHEKPAPVRIDEIRARCEELQRALALENYETGAGLKAESNVSDIYRRLGAGVTRHAIEVVRARLEITPPPEIERSPGGLLIVPGSALPPSGQAPLLFPKEALAPDEERRLKHLLEFQTEEFVGNEVRQITDEVVTREASARIQVGPGGAGGGNGGARNAGAKPPPSEEIAFRQAQAEISNSPDRERRALLEDASMRVIDGMTPLLAERVGIERGIARSFGCETYSELWRSVTSIDLAALDALLQGFLARTEDMYKEAMGWVVRKRIGVALADATRHDLHWLFRGAEWDDHFPKGDMMRIAERFTGEMGVDVRAGGNIKFDIEPRERKSARAFCAPVDVPGRVMLCVAPMGGRRDWQHVLHELGRALFHAHTSAQEPFEFRRLGDTSLPESYAFLLQYLLVDAGFCKRYLGMQKPKSYLFLSHLEKLAYLRRYAAKLHYELALHDGGEGGIEGKDALYEENMRKALGVRYPRELFLYDVDRHFYVARYLRAWLFEALLSKHLVHYFDEDWFRNPRTGEFLQKHWALGQRLTVEETAKEMGYAALDTAALEQEMLKAL